MIKVYWSGNYICPECSYAMTNEITIVRCVNTECQLFGKEFERPTLTLHEIIKEPECNHIIGLRNGVVGAIKVLANSLTADGYCFYIEDSFNYCPKCGDKI